MVLLHNFTVAQVHMNSAREAGIKAANCPHDVDSFKFVRTVFFEDRCVLNRILVRTGCTVDIPRIRIPASRWIRVIIGDFAVSNHQVMREHAANRLMETAADGLTRNLKRCEGLGSAGM